jgi:hypothetical protein
VRPRCAGVGGITLTGFYGLAALRVVLADMQFQKRPVLEAQPAE